MTEHAPLGLAGAPEQTRRRGAGGLRVVAVYLALVVVPVLIAVFLLADSDDGLRTASAHPAAGPTLARLLLAVAMVVGACKLIGVLARRIGQPPVIGEITAGILLGPSVLSAIWPQGAAWLFPPAVVVNLNMLAQIGVVLFVFLTGLEINTALLRRRKHVAVVVSHVSIAVPFLLGVAVAVVAYGKFAPKGVGFLAFALFFGVSMSVTALPVLIRILQDVGLFRSHVGVVALTCALVDDVTAWTLLALVVALVTASSLTGVLVTVGLTVAVVAVLYLVLRPLLARLVSRVRPDKLRQAAPLVLVLVLLSAMATEWIGVHAMFGAFVFGLIFPRGNVVEEWVHQKVDGLTTELMLPLFFAYSGLRTDLNLLGADPSMWLWCGVILLVAVAGKLGGSAVAARAVGENWNRALQVGVLMNCRGLTELVVLNVGLDLGVLSPALFTVLVIMALVSTAMAGPLVSRLARRAERLGQGGSFIPADLPEQKAA